MFECPIWLIEKCENLNLGCILSFSNTIYLSCNCMYENTKLVFKLGFGITVFPIRMWIESNKNKFIWKCGHKIIITFVLVCLVVILMRFFVCLDCQYCMANLEAVVDGSTVRGPTTVYHSVMQKSFEVCVNFRTHENLIPDYTVCTRYVLGMYD